MTDDQAIANKVYDALENLQGAINLAARSGLLVEIQTDVTISGMTCGSWPVLKAKVSRPLKQKQREYVAGRSEPL